MASNTLAPLVTVGHGPVETAQGRLWAHAATYTLRVQLGARDGTAQLIAKLANGNTLATLTTGDPLDEITAQVVVPTAQWIRFYTLVNESGATWFYDGLALTVI